MIKLNLARNCLRYIIKVYGIKQIYLPYYSCKVLWQACRKEKCKIKFYHIGTDFLPSKEFSKSDYILYINYFGLCDENCRKLSEKYPNLIVDNTQGFYSEPVGLTSFNSLRKFFKVQNGAFLYINKESDIEYEQDSFLFSPIYMNENYDEFLKNELLLDKEDIKYIYPKILKEMEETDFEQDKKNRLKNFQEYQNKYDKFNLIKLSVSEKEIPYCYPLCTKNDMVLKELSLKNKTLLSLWGEIPKHYPEHDFLNNTVALPLV